MSDSPPKVLIAGSGLAGLFLAILLERVNIPYQVFERAVKVKPLGSLMCLNANILPVFEQLGLLEELIAMSLPVHSIEMFNGDKTMITKLAVLKDIKQLYYA
ncbi:hypothetical protein BGZ68_003105 [Mortierella alpina]|nr:hypothetical protein BGZ68_003105 [Mortierella alpina]